MSIEGFTVMAAQPREASEAAARAENATIQEVVMLLRAILGPELVASIAGSAPRGGVAAWTQGRSQPSEVGAARMRVALELVLLVMEAEGLHAARIWLPRPNAALDGRSPLEVLAEERPRRARRMLLVAARGSVRLDRDHARVVPAGQPERHL